MHGHHVFKALASFPGSRAGEEEREPGTHCSRMRQVLLVTCILLCCTKIMVNSAYVLKGHTALLYSFCSLTKCVLYMSWCFDVCTHPLADPGPGTPFSVLEVMRVAQLASHALSLNLTMDLPPDYTPLSLAEVFYMATMGGAKGMYLLTELHKCNALYTTWAK